MAAKYNYYVIRQSKIYPNEWYRVTGSEGNRSYALGWFHALTSFLPRPAYKLVRYKFYNQPSNREIVEESPAQQSPSPQCTSKPTKR